MPVFWRLPSAALLAGLFLLCGCQSGGTASNDASGAGPAASDTSSTTEAFAATLSEAQRDTLRVDLTVDNADNWSNFPVGFVPRNGLQLRTLSAQQREQEKRGKYRDLVANAVMLRNVADLTDVLAGLRKDGHDFTRGQAERLSPYMTAHLKRFGQYVLDMDGETPPLEPKPLDLVEDE